MGRPTLPVGTAGEIRVYSVRGSFKARCLVRDYDGQVRHVERTARSESKAKARLREAIRDRHQLDADAEITSETRLSEAVRIWLVDLRAEVKAGEKSPGTADLYETTARRVFEGLGELRVREVTVGRIDRFLAATATYHGPVSAKRAKTVLSGVLGLAARHDAIRTNPVRDTARIKHGEKKSAVALDLGEVYDLRVKLAADQRAHDWDLLDFVDMMLATGKRIGENSAITWDAVDLDAGTVEIKGTVIRVKGEGLRIKWKPKTRAGYRKLRLPTWAVEMLRRRQAEAVPNEWNVVFTSPTGLLRDPSNTQADLRDVFTRLGYPWVTSHVFRKTAATLLDEAGVTARKIADQLGQSQVSVTQDFYLGRKIASEDAARVLEIIGRPDAAALLHADEDHVQRDHGG
ncbi:MAG: tyrosine-type recombinase/integrase [Pseudonocardiaceae bacterium]|nr:tyrosine-type recombinase/integrase [Pseudonocardiaceae bacterium]